MWVRRTRTFVKMKEHLATEVYTYGELNLLATTTNLCIDISAYLGTGQLSAMSVYQQEDLDVRYGKD